MIAAGVAQSAAIGTTLDLNCPASRAGCTQSNMMGTDLAAINYNCSKLDRSGFHTGDGHGKVCVSDHTENPVSILYRDFFIPMIIQIAERIRAI
jgi:hypothetical protein